MGIKHRLDRAHRATQESRDVEALASTFVAAVEQLRHQADGEDPPPGSRVEHTVKDVEAGTLGPVGKIKDLSE